ncbi:MAG: GntR family transcriptional regulator [Candidatus Puniceispirillum sp.]|jgi:DNA-binding GntR family transcriptional regulator
MTKKRLGDILSPIHVEAAPLRMKIIDAIRSAIEHGTLRPGDRLIEKQLCEQLGVSRTSLREALRELQAEGVIASVSARGLAVVEISRRDARDIYLIRARIEALIFEQFAEYATDAEIDALGVIYQDLIAAYNSGTFSAISNAKANWHNYVCKVTQNSVARNLLSRLTLRTAQLRNRSVIRKERQAQSIAELTTLMEALKNRDLPATAAAAQRHVLSASDSALIFAKDTVTE